MQAFCHFLSLPLPQALGKGSCHGLWALGAGRVQPWRKAARGRGAWQALKACHCRRPREPILQSNDDQRGRARQLVWHQGLGDAL